ncbi:MAG: flavin monoamine oxidase family protein [Phenylobacterium sp.]
MRAGIVIVGAGLCGLALAERLQRAGADYLLLEGRDRLGGRVLSQASGHGAFDLGPTWFWPSQGLMANLANRLGLGVFEQYADGDLLLEEADGKVIRAASAGAMARSLRIDGGMAGLTNALAARLPAERIRLGATVRGLTDLGGGIRIDCDGGIDAIRADQVVFALPPRLLAGSIALTPALPPAGRAALAAVPTWMAGQAKLVAVYDEPFWRAAGLSGDAVSRKGPLIEIHDASGRDGPAALFGFVGIAPAVRRARREQMLDMARRQLGRIFGDAALHPRELIFKDWAFDPLTATPDDLTFLGQHPAGEGDMALNSVWGGRILVSGTETAREHPGFLEGALEAAEETAHSLLKTARS